MWELGRLRRWNGFLATVGTSASLASSPGPSFPASLRTDSSDSWFCSDSDSSRRTFASRTLDGTSSPQNGGWTPGSSRSSNRVSAAR
ncbi:hypothetical protein PF008_g10388 [Phytophthora fragariae]|uniref:Uncharacterized protein n=1 Tax=Phytophthora fragariae TaxID=53985 RepID=A0A6G0RTS8_9STRA|nr:hypothetical protein PF008_g10388 [Phytophthora fragariae]